MESLFSISGGGTSAYKWITPPKGETSSQEEGFKEVRTASSDPMWVNSRVILERTADSRSFTEEELSDKEILLLASKSGSFSFWDDEEEDIYSEQDGTPIR